MLRLVSSTVGPLSIPAATATASQTVEAYNAGDGSLALSVSSSVSWIAATAGSARTCTTTTSSKSCIPIQLALSTSGLPAGLSTGVVTVSDPNAVDAPQTITVTVRLGGVDVHAAPGGSRDVSIATSSMVTSRATTQDGSSWLSLVLDGTGSFRFSYPYRIHLQPPAAMAQGVYNGSISTTGAAADTQTIPVTMRVTTQPIAQATPDHLAVRLAQGAPPTAAGVTVANLGQGTLSIAGASATGSGVTASAGASGVLATFDAGSLAPGMYNGSLAIATNAAEGTLAVPVSFEVVPKGAPLIYYQGVVDNGTFAAGDPIARGDVTVVLGEQLSFDPLKLGSVPPLDSSVGGAKVLLNGTQQAPMYYSSYGQLAFQMPVDAPLGTNLIQVQRDGLTSNTVSVTVAARAPRLLLVGATGYGAIQNATDNSLPMPEGAIPGVPTHPAKPGDILVIYAIGLGPTSPAVATGAPAPAAEPLARLTTIPEVSFGVGLFGATVQPSFAGLTPMYAGLYQLNVAIPPDTPKGIVDVRLAFPDSTSNSVWIAVE
jgi:uncharacterized protein (TIGR03437 family)